MEEVKIRFEVMQGKGVMVHLHVVPADCGGGNKDSSSLAAGVGRRLPGGRTAQAAAADMPVDE